VSRALLSCDSLSLASARMREQTGVVRQRLGKSLDPFSEDHDLFVFGKAVGFPAGQPPAVRSSSLERCSEIVESFLWRFAGLHLSPRNRSDRSRETRATPTSNSLRACRHSNGIVPSRWSSPRRGIDGMRRCSTSPGCRFRGSASANTAQCSAAGGTENCPTSLVVEFVIDDRCRGEAWLIGIGEPLGELDLSERLGRCGSPAKSSNSVTTKFPLLADSPGP
jgi:hypothetical protein